MYNPRRLPQAILTVFQNRLYSIPVSSEELVTINKLRPVLQEEKAKDALSLYTKTHVQTVYVLLQVKKCECWKLFHSVAFQF